MRRAALLLLLPLLFGGCRSTFPNFVKDMFVVTAATGAALAAGGAIAHHEIDERRRDEPRDEASPGDDEDVEKRWRAAKRRYGR